MVSKRTLPYIFLVAAFGIWAPSLLAIWFPTSRFAMLVFPLTLDDYITTIFLASMALSSVTSFCIGLDIIRTNLRHNKSNTLKTQKSECES
ncbi:MAG: hypothetical protein QXX08_10270 [Candidatus Bathyarchaeia archaeon]